MTSFQRDAEGDWVAQLECGHRQHVRHRPPFQVRPWVEDAQGRASRLGLPLECPLCDRAELPDDLESVRSVTWDEQTLPVAVRRAHRLGPSKWALLRVISGQVRYEQLDAGGTVRLLAAGATQAVPPGVIHRLEPVGDVQLAVDFFAVPPTHGWA